MNRLLGGGGSVKEGSSWRNLVTKGISLKQIWGPDPFLCLPRSKQVSSIIVPAMTLRLYAQENNSTGPPNMKQNHRPK